MRRKEFLRRYSFYIILFLFLANFLSWSVVFDLSKPPLLKVIFFNVGQGDAIFIETPQKHQILIDGGPLEDLLLEKISKEIPFYDRSIDLIILTHPESDHLRGLIGVLKSYKVDYVLITGAEKKRKSRDYKLFKELIEKEKSKIIFAERGERILSGGVNLVILYPFKNLKGKTFENTNNVSIVSFLKFNKISFLFTGDIYKKVEKVLIKENNLKANILKVAHHGSKTSTCQEFLKKVRPSIAVISVGKDNFYGHPHQEVLERLRKFNIKILRTDEIGDIKFLTDGFLVKINKKR